MSSFSGWISLLSPRSRFRFFWGHFVVGHFHISSLLLATEGSHHTIITQSVPIHTLQFQHLSLILFYSPSFLTSTPLCPPTSFGNQLPPLFYSQGTKASLQYEGIRTGCRLSWGLPLASWGLSIASPSHGTDVLWCHWGGRLSLTCCTLWWAFRPCTAPLWMPGWECNPLSLQFIKGAECFSFFLKRITMPYLMYLH